MRLQKVILASVMAVATGNVLDAAAASQSICSAPTVSANGTPPATGSFISVAFNVRCSAYVYLVGEDRLTSYSAGSASSKGKTIFSGSTTSAGVISAGACAAAGCTSTDAQSAATSAPSS